MIGAERDNFKDRLARKEEIESKLQMVSYYLLKTKENMANLNTFDQQR